MNFLRKNMINFFGLLLVYSCRRHDKSNHEFTTKITDGIYLETYSIYRQGAWGTDIFTDYLTDSTSFRLFIDTYDTEDEAISFSVKEDTIILTKYHFTKDREKDIVYKKIFPIEELKSINRFE